MVTRNFLRWSHSMKLKSSKTYDKMNFDFNFVSLFKNAHIRTYQCHMAPENGAFACIAVSYPPDLVSSSKSNKKKGPRTLAYKKSNKKCRGKK